MPTKYCFSSHLASQTHEFYGFGYDSYHYPTKSSNIMVRFRPTMGHLSEFAWSRFIKALNAERFHTVLLRQMEEMLRQNDPSTTRARKISFFASLYTRAVECADRSSSEQLDRMRAVIAHSCCSSSNRPPARTTRSLATLMLLVRMGHGFRYHTQTNVGQPEGLIAAVKELAQGIDDWAFV